MAWKTDLKIPVWFYFRKQCNFNRFVKIKDKNNDLQKCNPLQFIVSSNKFQSKFLAKNLIKY